MTWDVFTRKEKFCSREDPNCRLQNTRTCSFNAPITMPSKHQQTQGGLSILHQSHQNRQINGCRCRYPTSPRHTHITGGANKATCMTQQYSKIKHIDAKPRVPKLQSIFGSSLIKKCHFDIFYHFNILFYNIPFIRCYVFQFYTLK